MSWLRKRNESRVGPLISPGAFVERVRKRLGKPF